MGTGHGTTLAWALSWDGARCNLSTLDPFARSFLSKSQWPVLLQPTITQADHALEGQWVRELRIVWIPKISGGSPICSERVLIRRLAFRIIWRRTERGCLLTVFRPETCHNDQS